MSLPTTQSDRPPSRLIWTILYILCFIAAGVAIRRIVALTFPPAPRADQLAALDDAFATRSTLTLVHIIPALAFVLLIPAWLSRKVRARVATHRRITYALFILGTIIAITALLLSTHPIGGINESTAAILYDCFFLFSLTRAAWLLQHGDLTLHRTWMMRAIAILLGIATTRPVMGVFFATQRLTHLTPQQFFGTAFWIGFTITYIAGEAYLRTHPVALTASST